MVCVQQCFVELAREIERRKHFYNNVRRVSNEYVAFVDEFLEHAFGLEKRILCPCRDCMNRVRTDDRDLLKLHLYKRGFTRDYLVWTFHGEKSPPKDTPKVNEVEREHASLDEMCEEVVDEFRGRPEVLEKFLGEKDNPLYSGCKNEYTVMSCLMELFNIKASGSWSDTSFNKLLKLLNDILPEGNSLPDNLYTAKRILCPMGLEYKKIHACPNDCVLYRNELKDEKKCPICNVSRYKNKQIEYIDGSVVRSKKQVPAKCVWYLPIIPRLKRLFRNSEDSKNLRWYKDRDCIEDDMIRHPADGDQWKKFDLMYPDFASEPRNLRFVLCTDGMNPFGDLSSKHSSWPVMLAIYNLPPYLCMKRKYVMMPLMISGPKQPGNDIDTYLAPLIEDLQELWNPGVLMYDGFLKSYFTCRGMLFCTVNDLPAYGNMSGYVVKGHKACPICEEDTDFLQLKNGRKTVFLGYRKFLGPLSKLRGDTVNYVGGKERKMAPKPKSGVEIHRKVKLLKVILGKRKKKNNAPIGPWKKRSIFFDLPYWEFLDVRHCLDVMHIEKNVCESLIGTLLNVPGKTKDSLNARKDLVELGIKNDLAPEVRGKRTYLPPAPYTLSTAERRSVCECIRGIKVPAGYSSNVSRFVSDDLRLNGLKSHDCHVLMQQLLPVALRGVLEEDVRFCVTRLCIFFHSICRKALHRTELDELEKEAINILCQLEKYFPPAFFDIMVHLVIHLVREIRICGPVGMHWMFPFERHMGVFKGYVSCPSRPDASIVQGYVTEEIIEYCTTNLVGRKALGVPENRHISRRAGTPRSKGTLYTPYHAEMMKVHLYVLRNSSETAPFVEEHLELLVELHGSDFPKNQLQVEHSASFIEWFHNRCNVEGMSKNLRAFARKPDCTVRRYTGYDINGWSFSTTEKDTKSTTQNSGVYNESETILQSSKRDKNPLVVQVPFYGQIEEIWELNYVAFKVVVFKCKWVDHKSVRTEKPMGFTLVDLNHVGSKNDNFILASQARQVFYIKDPCNPKWSVALHGKKFFFNDEIDCPVMKDTPDFPSAFPTLDKCNVVSPVRRSHDDGLWVDENGEIVGNDGVRKRKR